MDDAQMERLDPARFAEIKQERLAKNQAAKMGKVTMGAVDTEQEKESTMERLQRLDDKMMKEQYGDAPEFNPDNYAHSYINAEPVTNTIDPQKYEDEGMSNITIQGHKIIDEGMNPVVKIGDEWHDTANLDVPGYFDKETEKTLKSVHDEYMTDQQSFNKLQAGIGDYIVTKDGLTDNILRAKLSAADTFATKKEMFKTAYPNGELGIDGDGTLKFKMELADPWEPVNPKMGVSGVGDVSEDFMDMLGSDAGALIGEVGFAMAKSKGAGALWTGVKAAFGAIVGDMAQEQIESFYGMDQEQAVSEQFTQAMIKGGFSLGGTGLFMIGGRTWNALSGEGFLSMSEPQRMIIQQARGLGINAPTIGSVTKSKGWLKMEAQADSVSNKITDYVEQAQNQIKAKLKRNINSGQSDYLIDGHLKNDLTNYWQATQAKAKVTQISKGDAGDELIKQYDTWKTDSQEMVGAAYEQAKAIEPPQLDIAGMKKGMAEADQKRMVNVTKLQKEGQDIYRRGGKIVPHKVKRPIQADTPTIVEFKKLINELDEELVDMDQLIRIRGELYDLKTPTDANGAMTHEMNEAQRLYGVITKTMRNPINKNPAAIQAYKAANDLAKQRFDLMDAQMVLDIAKTGQRSGSGSKLIGRIIDGADESSIKQIQALLKFNTTKETKGMWRNVQEQYKASLMDEPLTMVSRLDKMDKNAKKLLLNKSDENMLRAVGGQLQDLTDSGILKAVDKQATVGDMVKKVIFNNDKGDVVKLKNFMKKNPAAKQAFRQGVMEEIVDRVTNRGIDKNGKLVNAVEMNKIIKSVIDTPVGALFVGKKDMAMIRKVGPLVQYFNSSGDIGSSLLGSTVMAGVSRLEGKAIVQLIKYNGLGKMLTNDSFLRFMTGSGNKPWSRRIRTQLLTQAATTMAASNKLSAWYDNPHRGEAKKAAHEAMLKYSPL